jgi:RimJ/RimL family protein N-acetyltransferase
MRPPELLTPRLRLRELGAADADGIFRLYSEPETMRYWSCPPYSMRRQAEELLASIARGQAAGELLEWGVAERADGRLLGTVTLHQLDAANRRAWVCGAWRRTRIRATRPR